MHAKWASLKEIVNCRGKLSDVVVRPEKLIQYRSYIAENEGAEEEVVHPLESPMCQVILKQDFGRQDQTQKWFYELNTGHPSRNVIEMIFRAASAASTHPSKHSLKIKKVLRVNNPIERMERFESYRETMKKKAFEQCKQNPRSMVDGNEQLRFYGTTMTCWSRKPNQVSELCRDPCCRVCRIIQSGFNTEYTRKNGIQLSTSSQDLSENTTTTIMKRKPVMRAAILCRTIAGKILRVVNMIGGENVEAYDSIGSGGMFSKFEYLIVKNPSAILPCFVIVFS